MLKRVTFIIAAVSLTLLGAGCAKTYDPAPEQDAAILFGAGSLLLNDDYATKAPLESGTTFGVFAFKQAGTAGAPGTWNSSRTPEFMFNVPVSFDGSTCSYSPIRFWPDPASSTVSFWAYSPYDENALLLESGSTASAYTSSSTGLPDMRYTADGHTDFMVSDLVKNQTYASNSGVVELPFGHALSKVDVSVQKQDPEGRYTVTLKNVSFNGIYFTGTIRWNTSTEIWAWALWSGLRQNLGVWEDDPEDDSDDIVLTTSSQSLPAVMPLPQNLTDAAARLHVEFSVSYEGILHERSTTREVLLSKVFEDAGAAWSKNSHYTLNITISPDDPIEFTVSWSDWGDVYNFHITD